MDIVELEKNKNLVRHPWETVRIKVIADRLKEILGEGLKASDTINILDVGSGDAFVIDQLAQQFPNLNFIGIDINYTPEIIERIQTSILTSKNVKLFNDWEALELTQTKISLVLLLDVIEHVEDDVRLMKQVREKLSGDFKYIITVPAFQFLFSEHDVFLVHFRRYNNALLKKNIQAAGWIPQNTAYFFFVPLLMRMATMLKETLFPKQKKAEGISGWQAGPQFTKMVETVLWSDYKLGKFFSKFGVKLPGLSNISLGKSSAS